MTIAIAENIIFIGQVQRGVQINVVFTRTMEVSKHE